MTQLNLTLPSTTLKGMMMLHTDGINTEAVFFDHDGQTTSVPISNIEEAKLAVERCFLLMQCRNRIGNFSGNVDEITLPQEVLEEIVTTDHGKGW
jgi:hypothetical protein